MKITFSIALKAIWVNKVRSFLTMLGVIIGVGSVVLLTAIGNGISAFVTNQFDELGANTLIIFPGDVFGDDGNFDRESQINALSNSKLKLSDVRQIERISEYVEAAVPFNSHSDLVSYKAVEETSTIIGTTAEYEQAQGNLKVDQGRFYTKTEDDTGKRVVFLGSAVAEELFDNVDPVGKRIKIGGQTFTVLGTAEEIGGGFGGGPSFDSYVYIPLKTAFRLYDDDSILEIIVKTRNKDQIPEAIKAIEKVMLLRFDEDEFSVFDQSEILSAINEILGVLTVGLGGIAAISLVVGGIGIMNIMLVSVTERTREIGLRKALGATPNVILTQFLIEAALLSVMGGMIGVGLAYLGSLALGSFIPARVTLDAVLLAFGVSTAVGLIFGAAPARRAAKMSPIEALRYE